ncbi:MAG: DegV family protein [Clostridia bacterium]|nr:DegV family protein [Clostridia bacterium]
MADITSVTIMPKTAAITMADYEDLFRSLTEGGNEVIHFNISSGFSCAHQNALIAAEEIPGVYVIDSRNLSTGTALLALKAYDMIAEGKSAKEIYEEMLKLTEKVDASFVLDTLEYLHKEAVARALPLLAQTS